MTAAYRGDLPGCGSVTMTKEGGELHYGRPGAKGSGSGHKEMCRIRRKHKRSPNEA
jgi:hypothetical protein